MAINIYKILKYGKKVELNVSQKYPMYSTRTSIHALMMVLYRTQIPLYIVQ